MTIYRLLEREVFELEDVALMSVVFEELLETLGLADRREDPVASLVAQKVIELAQTGIRDPIRLKHWSRLDYRIRASLGLPLQHIAFMRVSARRSDSERDPAVIPAIHRNGQPKTAFTQAL